MVTRSIVAGAGPAHRVRQHGAVATTLPTTSDPTVATRIPVRRPAGRTFADPPGWAFLGPSALLLGLLGGPLVMLLWTGVTEDFAGYLREPTVREAIRLSLLTSVASTTIVVSLGTPLAYLLALRSFRGRWLVELLVDLPIVLPPMVAGIALLLAFGTQGWFGSHLAALGIRLPFTTFAVVLAQAFVATPLFVRAARVGFAAVDHSIIEASVIDGAGELQRFRHVLLPSAEKALLTGVVLAWARALGEFGATIFFAGNLPGTTQTMPLAIFIGFESNLGTAIALSVILMLASAAVLVVLRLFGDRRAG